MTVLEANEKMSDSDRFRFRSVLAQVRALTLFEKLKFCYFQKMLEYVGIKFQE